MMTMMNAILAQAQTASSAATEIILMLLVAALIGVVTTYLYMKAKYKKLMALLKAQLDDCTKDGKQLKQELEAVNATLTEKSSLLDQLKEEKVKAEEERSILEKKYKALKDLHAKLSKELEEAKQQLHSKDNQLKEKDTVLQRISQRKHLLDYDSFGMAKKEQKDDLKLISGVGPFIEEKLNMLDIFTFSQISKFSKNDIDTVNEAIEFFPGRIERDQWVPQAIELAKTGGKVSEALEKIKARRDKINYKRIGTAKKEDADDLTVISGIGAWIQDKLNALDIYTYKQIASFTQEDEKSVTEAIEFFPGRIERDEWVPQAKELVHSGGRKTELFDRMKSKKHRIDYNTIGVAHAENAQDLTRISGIGTFIQDKLNFLGIYTFEQISRFTEKDIETVTDIIEFFPGRIQRDHWVEQATELAKEK
jgi:predicted flap endonuclease-1-like 5' DNA nuclease